MVTTWKRGGRLQVETAAQGPVQASRRLSERGIGKGGTKQDGRRQGRFSGRTLATPPPTAPAAPTPPGARRPASSLPLLPACGKDIPWRETACREACAGGKVLWRACSGRSVGVLCRATQGWLKVPAMNAEGLEECVNACV